MSKRNEVIHGISATRASAILGLNDWKTPLLAWQEIQEKLKPGFNADRGFILPPREDKAVFRWGHAFEKSIIHLAENAQKKTIGKEEALAKDDGDPAAFCYLDGVYFPFDEEMILHEGKTTFERAFHKKWGEPGTDRVPTHIQIQAQHQMLCSGADENIVSVLVLPKIVDDFEENGWRIRLWKTGKYTLEKHDEEGNVIERTTPLKWAHTLENMGYFHQYPIKSDRDNQKLLREAYDFFWKKYVLTEEPPECDDYEDVRRVFTEPKGHLVVPEEVQNMLREFSDINKELGKSGHLSKRKESLKLQILKYANTATSVADDDSQEKVTFLDDCGNSLGSFNGKTFRAK